MKVAGRGRITIWEGASLWLMDALPVPGSTPNSTAFHSHHAIQVTMSLGGAFILRTRGHSVAGDAVVSPDVEHQFETQGRIAILFVEPESRSGRAIVAAQLGERPLAPLSSRIHARRILLVAAKSLPDKPMCVPAGWQTWFLPKGGRQELASLDRVTAQVAGVPPLAGKPVLILSRAHRPAYSSFDLLWAQAQADLVRRYPESEHRVSPGVSHNIHGDQPAWFLATVEEFIQRGHL